MVIILYFFILEYYILIKINHLNHIICEILCQLILNNMSFLNQMSFISRKIILIKTR